MFLNPVSMLQVFLKVGSFTAAKNDMGQSTLVSQAENQATIKSKLYNGRPTRYPYAGASIGTPAKAGTNAGDWK